MISACKGDGNKSQSIPTISQQVSNNKTGGSIRNLNLEIKQTELVFTTNTEGINKSSNLINTNQTAVPDNTIKNNIGQNNSNNLNSLLFVKNVKGLKLNTNLKVNRNDCTSNQPTPQTCESTCSFDENQDKSNVSVRNLARHFNKMDRKVPNC